MTLICDSENCFLCGKEIDPEIDDLYGGGTLEGTDKFVFFHTACGEKHGYDVCGDCMVVTEVSKFVDPGHFRFTPICQPCLDLENSNPIPRRTRKLVGLLRAVIYENTPKDQTRRE